jgi:hypothetical protein
LIGFASILTRWFTMASLPEWNGGAVEEVNLSEAGELYVWARSKNSAHELTGEGSD